MIYRITSNEWLKRASNMTKPEIQELVARIEAWLKHGAKVLLTRANEPTARMMNVEQVSGEWTSDEQDAFKEGVQLMTSFVNMDDTWLPTMIYTKAAKRSIHRIIDILAKNLPKFGVTPPPVLNIPTPKPHNHKSTKPHNRTTERLQPIVTESVAVVSRPKHIDQYIHLLPEETQKRAANYGQLIKDLGTARGNMRLLLDDAKATATERERWAKTAVALDQKVGELRKELDAEWNKLAALGRITIDVFGIAHLLDENGNVSDSKPNISANVNIKNEEPPKLPKKARTLHEKHADEEIAARVKYLQKWLRDTRPAATPEHKERWQENVKELIQLGGGITKSIEKAGEYYNAKIPR